MKNGAMDFLTKPFSDADVLCAIRLAISRDRADRATRGEIALLKQRYRALTPRERDVLPLVVSGLLNKQAAAQLGISEVTLQVHRRNVMAKMGATSLADLVRIAQRIEIPLSAPRRAEGSSRE